MKKIILNPTGENFSGTIEAYNNYARGLNTMQSCIKLIGADTTNKFFKSDNKRWFKPDSNIESDVTVSVFIEAMNSALHEVKLYRRGRLVQGERSKQLKSRWVDHVDRVEGLVSGMREHLSIKLHFTPTQGALESSDADDSYFNGDSDQADYAVTSRYSGAEVTLPISLSYFSKVMPLFNNGINPSSSKVVYGKRIAKVNGEAVTIRAPYLESMGQNTDLKIRYQYLVLDVGDVIDEIDGNKLDHKLKVRSFTAFETYGNADKKYYKQAKKFVCYMGDYFVSHRHAGYNGQSITAIGDTAKKAYALARRRIAKNLMDQM